MSPAYKMTDEDKIIALQLFKAHFAAKEAAIFFSFGYATLRNLFRGFELADIQKYDRMQLIEGDQLDRETIETITQHNT